MISPPETGFADVREPVVPGSGQRIWLTIGGGAIAGLLVVVGLVVLLSATGPTRPGPAAGQAGAGGTPLTAAPAVGHLAPPFTLPNGADQAVRLTDFRGHPVWLNFWASWCGPCRAEMPEMQRLYAKYKDQGLVLLSVDLGESRETVTHFITANKYDWIFLRDSTQQVGQTYYIGGIPTHAFIDRAGVIRRYVVSGLTPPLMESYLAEILGK